MEQFVCRVLPLLTIFVSFVVFFYLQDSYSAQLSPILIKLPENKCSLLHHHHFWITSKRIVTPQGIISGSVEINEGKIISVIEGYAKQEKSNKQEKVIDYGDAVVMPGLIDVHVHLNEPGRTEWEGFDAGTRAAAAGGVVTTVVDMPLNNHPTTVSKETLKLKLDAAEDKIYVDVGFWGGLIPENALNKSILEGLLSAGVLGVKLPKNKCSLLHHRHFWITSKRIVTPQGIISGSVEINKGKIISVIGGYAKQGMSKQEKVIDYGDAVVMPGLIDVHVHLDEPGITNWEGYSGTKAAAAGGVTTVVDMPLNNHPTTVSKETLKLKLEAAQNKIYVDVGFWGGLIPENALNTSIPEGLLKAGVLGLKSFMCPSGISDFPMTTIHHIKERLSVLAKYKRPLLVHAESQPSKTDLHLHGDPRAYLTYLNTRPPSWEEAAIKQLVSVTKHTSIGGSLEEAHVHIAHLSDSSVSLDLIKEAKSRGDSISAETCPHYLAFSSEEIPNGDTRFKCSPPIRDASNKEKPWEAVLEGHIDLLSPDHSPTVPELKLLEDGDFLKAWGAYHLCRLYASKLMTMSILEKFKATTPIEAKQSS